MIAYGHRKDVSVNKQGFDVVTGAFGYTGRYIAKRLVAQGRTVATLTRRTQPAGLFPQPLQRIVPNYADRDALAAQLQGADTLYNTYWVRFDHGGTGHEAAVEHSRTLFAAARMAGVSKIVHVSIAHADSRSPLPYYRGKGQVEEALRGEGVPYVIIRPTLVFGREDILVNNIAWFLRRFPLFGLPGSGDYSVRPVFVEDVADLALQHRSCRCERDSGRGGTGKVHLPGVGGAGSQQCWGSSWAHRSAATRGTGRNRAGRAHSSGRSANRGRSAGVDVRSAHYRRGCVGRDPLQRVAKGKRELAGERVPFRARGTLSLGLGARSPAEGLVKPAGVHLH